ncbi:G-D-S-L family lipolytic protein [Aquimarina sp. 2201CG14-23]|uniref:G-D-S-L family lipolytic protein n=1 Tax=Aquimarina mycalae TaxID=3040073 RepID=UPI002478037E|nr:G-D-S-L family lipolytic protein [Aquimarina sp. 2201CG14-23]MDH7446126.1 G-D-S-L family lipolytic protein [Aquimarina sp. 2201CG14-23]
MNIQYKWLLILFVFGFVACESDDDSPVVEEVVITSGTADFSTYVALGNSLTAGFTDGALFIAAQENSMPNILAQQFALAGGGTFTQPLMSDNVGGALLGGTQILSPRFFFNGAGPAVLPATPTTEISAGLSGTFNNMGIPGAKSFHLLANGYGNIAGLPSLANPYFVRMASSPNASVLEDAMAQNPTFFSLWIGNNDVLGYALSGGDGSDPITDTATFDQAYGALVATLTSGGAKGVIANIPDVTSIANFTTVSHNPVPLDAATAGAVNAAYALYNGGIVQAFAGLVMAGAISQEDADAEIARRTISFTAGEGNAVVILDEDLTDLTGLNPNLTNMRQATADDLLVLASASFIGTLADPGNPLSVNGVAIPLADRWVLTPEEQAEIATATTAFNATISAAAQQAGLAFVDANALLVEVASTGIAFDEFLLQGDLVFGGAFSLDGVHPTARGYAFIANKTMEAINATYGSNLPMVKAEDYPTFYSPMLP